MADSAGIDSALRHIKPQIRAIGAYTLRPYETSIKLNQNENPYDVPAELKRGLLERLAERPWNRYPPFVATDFISAVSEMTGWPTDGVLVGNGSNELIQALIASTVEPGVSVVVPEPTFTLYRLLTAVGGGDFVSVPLERDFGFDVPAIARAAGDPQTGLVVVCTPNNPTGSSLTREQIESIYESTDALLVLDQAYVEFGGYDALELLKDRPRLVILRTFSKAMSLAGLRAGYLLAHPELAIQIAKAKLPYNINFFTEAVAAEVLRNREMLQPRVDELRRERDRLMDEMSRIPGIHVFPSDANFILFRIDRSDIDHRVVFDRLMTDDSVLVRDVSGYPMLERCLRVNAGTPGENDVFLRGLREILSEEVKR